MVKLLLLAGSPGERRALASLLQSAGYRVALAADGRTLRASLADRACRLVIVDIDRPNADGVELIRAVRRARPRLPVLAVAGGSPEMPAAIHLLLAEVYGADATLQKPVQRSDLLTAVARLLRSN